MRDLTRRFAMSGALCALGGCSALGALNDATKPLNTYELRPAAGSRAGRKTRRTLLVARPQASAVLATDRMMVKPDAISVTYLPDARWGDELPVLLQSLIIRSIAGTERVGYVGSSDGGPVPDKALLSRLDAFEVVQEPDGRFTARVDINLSLINDGTQSVVASRRFEDTEPLSQDDVATIVQGFQAILNRTLPRIANWAVAGL